MSLFRSQTTGSPAMFRPTPLFEDPAGDFDAEPGNFDQADQLSRLFAATQPTTGSKLFRLTPLFDDTPGNFEDPGGDFDTSVK